MLNKIIVIAILFITIASAFFCFKVFQGKDFKKEKSFDINHIKEIDVDNENWDIEFKSTDSNKFVETKSGDIVVRYKGVPTSLKLTAKSNSSDVMVNVNGLKKDKNTEKIKEGTIGDAKKEAKISSETGVIYID